MALTSSKLAEHIVWLNYLAMIAVQQQHDKPIDNDNWLNSMVLIQYNWTNDTELSWSSHIESNWKSIPSIVLNWPTIKRRVYSLRMETFKFLLQFIDRAIQVQVGTVVVGFELIFGCVLALVELKCTVLELKREREREC